MTTITYKNVRTPIIPVGDLPMLALFARGEQGAWYDPSDKVTMFQDAVGNVPVTAAEQPVGLILDKSPNGNHATQATTTARPVWTARKNLATYSEAQNGNFGGQSGRITPVDGVNTPIGTVRVLRKGTDGSAYAYASPLAVVVGDLITVSVYARRTDKQPLVFGGGASASSSLNDMTVCLNGNTVASALTVVPLSDGWHRVSATAVRAAGTLGVISYNPTVEVEWTGLQIERAPAATRYQKINTATDYDTAGFLYRLRFDGIDDYLSSAKYGNVKAGSVIAAAVGFSAGTRTGTDLFMGLTPIAASDYHGVGVRQSAGSARAYARNSVAGAFGVIGTPGEFPAETRGCISSLLTETFVSRAVNRLAPETIAAAWGATTGAAACATIGYVNAPANVPFDFYGGVIVANSTDTARAQAVDYLMGKIA